MPDEASKESVRVLNPNINSRKSSISSRKPLSRDTEDAKELYGLSQMDIQLAMEQTPPGSDTICEASKRASSDRQARIIVDRDATSDVLDLDEFRDRYDDHRKQHAQHVKKLLHEGVINRIEATWCCRCQIMTNFREKKCVTTNCQHERCLDCRKFGQGRAAEAG